jgi:hypothetical protein
LLFGLLAGFVLGCIFSLYDSGADIRAQGIWGGGLALVGMLIGTSGWLLSDRHKYFNQFRAACMVICVIVFVVPSSLDFWDSSLWHCVRHELGVVGAFTIIVMIATPFCLVLGAVWGFVLTVCTLGNLRWMKPKSVSFSIRDFLDL